LLRLSKSAVIEMRSMKSCFFAASGDPQVFGDPTL
jgi:hypothetical protein